MLTCSSRLTKAVVIVLAAIVGGALLHGNSAAYCVFATDTGNRLHWPAGAVIGNTINPADADLLAAGPVVAAVNAAQFDWNAAPPAARWTFVLGGPGVGDPLLRDGTNIIGFGDLSSLGIGPEAYAATALWYVAGGPNDGVITEFGIVFNIDGARTWSWATIPLADDQIDLQSIAVHQLGHVLGTAHSNTNGLGACAEGLPYLDAGTVMQPMFSPLIAVNPNRTTRVLVPDDVASNNLPVFGEVLRGGTFRSVDTDWRLRRGLRTLAGNTIAGAASYLLYPSACTDLGLGAWVARTSPVGDSLDTYAVGTTGDYSVQDYSSGGIGTLWHLQAGNNVPTPDFCSPQKLLASQRMFFGGDPVTHQTLQRSNSAFVTCPIPVPAGTQSLTARWSQYLNLPRGSGYLPYAEYRFFSGGTWYGWRDVFPAEDQAAGSTQAWGTEAGDLTEAAGAPWVQLRFGMECVPYLAMDHLNCPSISVGLMYDDLVLYAKPGPALPSVHVFPGSVPQSTFVNGTILGVNCTAIPCWPGIRGTQNGDASAINDNVNSPLGDSLTVTITSSLGVDGNGINWQFGYDKTIGGGMVLVAANPGFIPAFGPPKVFFRLFDPLTRSWSPWDDSALDADDVQVVAGVPIVQGSRYRWNWPPRDKVAVGALIPGGFTINGVAAYAALNFLPRGTRIQYFFKGVDAAGAQTFVYSTDMRAYEVEELPILPAGVVPVGVAPDFLEFDVLPRIYPAGTAGSLLAGRTNTPVLNLDGAYTAWSFGQDPVTRALRGLGVRADRYRALQGLGEGGHIGGHEFAGERVENPRNYFPNMNEYPIKDSLASWYRIIIESGHQSGGWTVADEQDSKLLREWLQTPTPGTDGGDRCLLVTGDDFFEGLLNSSTGMPNPEQTSLSQNVLGVQTAVGAWPGTFATPRPVINDRFADPASGPALGAVDAYTYPVDGGCPGFHSFDGLTIAPTPDAFAAATYPGGGASAAAVARKSEFDPIGDHDRSKGLGYGYSIQFIRKAGFDPISPPYAHSGVENRMQVLYKFLTGCRGARSGLPADVGVCWPCPSSTAPGTAGRFTDGARRLATGVANWAAEPAFLTGTYGPLYAIQDPGLITGIDEPVPDRVPGVNTLAQNRPNPFNPTTEIAYSVSTGGRVTIQIFNVAGQLVRPLVDATVTAGPHAARWDGRRMSGEPLASGVYFYVITFPDKTSSAKKMIMLR